MKPTEEFVLFHNRLSTKDGSDHTIVGIIPTAKNQTYFSELDKDFYIPINKNYLAIERAIIECAMAGCRSIWIVSYKEDILNLRKRYKEFFYFHTVPLRRLNFMTKRLGLKFKKFLIKIPIYYVPIHPSKRGIFDCLGWSALLGAEKAFWVYKQISFYCSPSKFYVAFPYSVYDPYFVNDFQPEIRSSNNFILRYKEKSIFDGYPIGFTFNLNELKKYLLNIYTNLGWKFNEKKGNFFSRCDAKSDILDASLNDIFIKDLLLSKEVHCADLPWYYRIDGWNYYKDYMKSSFSSILTKPTLFTKTCSFWDSKVKFDKDYWKFINK
ncbi:hypothetical protein M0R19_04030 [Candidatus Pacearchaeota archaeon]|jgi:hypothetical protein|nr:hypothetical protein [Candidatus Pacearchaeota archaeon]